MMKLFARWVSKRRNNAVIATTLVALLLPHFVFIGAAVVVLTTLRQGTVQGLIVAAAAAGWLFGGALVAQLAGGGALAANLASLGIFAAAIWLPALWLATWLGRSRSLRLVIKLAVGATLLAIALVYVVTDPARLWSPLLETWFAFVAGQSGEPAPGPEIIALLARMLTGSLATFWLVFVVAGVLLGHWWQALIDDPGSFGREYRTVHLGRVIPAVAGVVFIGSAVADIDVINNMVTVCVFAFLLQGLAVVHHLLRNKRWRVPALVLAYGAIVAGFAWFLLAAGGLHFPPGELGIYVSVALVMVGFADCLFDFRARFAR